MKHAENGPDLHVVLVEPEIPWNTGNAGRSCLAAGAHLHLVEPLGFKIDEKSIRRSGLDYWSQVPLTVWPDFPTLENRLFPGVTPVFFTAEAKQTFWEADFRGPSLLIFGCEGSGLPQDIRRKYQDHCVAIPMEDPAVRSLNLSTSVALGLWEARRQRGWGLRKTMS